MSLSRIIKIFFKLSTSQLLEGRLQKILQAASIIQCPDRKKQFYFCYASTIDECAQNRPLFYLILIEQVELSEQTFEKVKQKIECSLTSKLSNKIISICIDNISYQICSNFYLRNKMQCTKIDNNSFHFSQNTSVYVNNALNQVFCSVQDCLLNLKQAIDIPQNIRNLRQFVENWEEVKLISECIADQHNLAHGMDLLYKISAIEELYTALHKKEISTYTFKQKVETLLKSEQHGITSQFSVHPRIPKVMSVQSACNSKQQSPIMKSKHFNLDETLDIQQIIPITQNEYGLKKAEFKNKECWISVDNSIIKSFRKNFQQQNKRELSEHKYGSIISPKNLPRKNKPQTQHSCNKPKNKLHNFSVDVTNMTNQKGLEKINLNKACEIYQIDEALLNISNRNQKENILKCFAKQQKPQRLKLQKAIYASTSRSIEAYRNYIKNSKSKEKSETYSKSKDSSRSLIKRQYENLRSREKKSTEVSSKNLRSGDSTNYAHFYSLNQQKHILQYSNTELLLDKSEQYFADKSSKFKKRCLKNKSLLYESRQLEVGYVHFRKGTSLDFILFITSKIHLQSLTINIENTQNLQIQTQVRKLQHLQADRQYSFKIQTILKSMPFKSPKILLTLKQKKSTFKQLITLYLPCSINKFLDFDNKPSVNEINLRESKNKLLRTCCFKLIKRLSNTENIKKMLPFFRPIPVNNKLRAFRTQCKFEAATFVIDLVQEQKEKWFLVGSSSHRQTKYLQFILHSFFYILSE